MSFVPQILRTTNGRGVDVVLNSLTGDKLHASLELCAKFGRFVEIGKRDILDAGNLNMRIFERNITFSAFDLHELYYSPLEAHQERYSKLRQDAVALYRKVGAPAPMVFDVSEISGAFRLFSNGTRIGKIVVNFEEPDSQISYLPQRYVTQFTQAKSYLLVGCLGGLGRSIARYMLAQGARHFSFIGRSGVDRAAVKSLIEDLERCGATVDVVRGDVQDFETVRCAVDRLKLPLGGVVQAAMALAESLFTSMTHSQWRNVLGPKVQGSWNIHRAIAGKDAQLDFFLMTGSLSGSLLSPTESNYCAANCFLDYFAGYRRSLGLPATSLALGQVNSIGYIHEHAEIEQMLARRGLADLSEDDMLCFIDIALSSQESCNNDALRQAQSSSVMAQTNGHLLTGLEAARMGAIWNQGYQGSLEMLKVDPRLHILLLATPQFAKSHGTSAGGPSSGSGDLPEAVSRGLAMKDDGGKALFVAVFEVLAERLSHLILMPREKVSQELLLSEIGMDSMLAAEYRTFIFRALTVDVPFLTLMDSKSRIENVVGLVCKTLVA